MTKKICGWYRIGIVLSIIWVLLVSGVAIYECFRDRKVPLESGFIGIITRSMFFNVEVVEDKVIEDKKIGFTPLSPSTEYELKFKTKRFLSVLFLPILGMWGLLLGMFRAVLWIKEGFKKQ